MKLYITVGTTDGSGEMEFIIPDNEHATYIGLEIDNPQKDEKSPRLTIMRRPFIQHGITPIHTTCRLGTDEIEEVEM